MITTNVACLFIKDDIMEFSKTINSNFVSIQGAGTKVYKKILDDVVKMKIFLVSVCVVESCALLFSFPIFENGPDFYYTIKFFQNYFIANYWKNLCQIIYYSSFPGLAFTILAFVFSFVYILRHCAYQCILLHGFIENISTKCDERDYFHRNQKQITERLKFCIRLSMKTKV